MKEGRKEELASSREQLLRALRLAAFLTLCLKDLLLQIVRSREEAWQKKPGSLRLASCKGQGLAPHRMLFPFSTQILLSHLPHYCSTTTQQQHTITKKKKKKKKKKKNSSDPLPAKDQTATISNNTTIQLRRCQNHLRNMRERERERERTPQRE